VAAFSVVRYVNSPWRKLPPGPAGLPILGNVLQMGGKQWLTFSNWRDKYGDLIYLNVAGQPLVVISSQKIVGDLLNRRSKTYSDRPKNIVPNELMTGGMLITFTHYNDVWRRLRKAAHEALNKGVVHNYHATQAREAVLLAHG
ncbi:cytochrome P450, partial [Stereum hirsutum FP-91666 SS1]|uniref:cytochrome P450 n=1 Tax=Stereum hirsutum (strain FP-91666) TaxID=721885 RepID=UPI000444A0D9